MSKVDNSRWGMVCVACKWLSDETNLHGLRKHADKHKKMSTSNGVKCPHLRLQPDETLDILTSKTFDETFSCGC